MPGSEPSAAGPASAASSTGPFWRRVAATGGAQAYGVVISTLAVMLTARWLGPSGRGEVAAAAGWAASFATLGHLSLGQVAAYSMAGDGSHDTDRSLTATLGTLLVAGAVVVGVSWLIGGVLVVTGSSWLGELGRGAFLAGLLLMPGLLLEQYVTPLLLARDRVAVLNVSQVAGRTTLLILLALAWLAGAGPVPVLVCMAGAQAVVVVTGGAVLWRETRAPFAFSARRLAELASGGARLHLNFVGDFLMSSAGLLLVNAVAAPAEAAFYQLAIQLINIVVILPQAAALVYVPHVVRLGPEAGWRYQRATLLVLLLVVVLGCAASAAIVPAVIPWLLGAEYAQTVPVFWWLLLTVPVITLSRVLGPQWLARQWYLHVSLLTLGAGIVNVAAGAILVPRSGSVGAAQALTVAYIPVLVAQVTMLIRCERADRAGRS